VVENTVKLFHTYTCCSLGLSGSPDADLGVRCDCT